VHRDAADGCGEVIVSVSRGIETTETCVRSPETCETMSMSLRYFPSGQSVPRASSARVVSPKPGFPLSEPSSRMLRSRPESGSGRSFILPIGTRSMSFRCEFSFQP
jgi:hypothetical protein